MSPKDKAKQLYDNAFRMLYLESNTPLTHNLAIKVSRFSINEMLNHYEQMPEINTAKRQSIIYYEEVLYHLENLENQFIFELLSFVKFPLPMRHKKMTIQARGFLLSCFKKLNLLIIKRATNYKNLLCTILKRVVIFHNFKIFDFLSSHRREADFQVVTRDDICFLSLRFCIYRYVIIFFIKKFVDIKRIITFALVVFHLLKESVSETLVMRGVEATICRGFLFKLKNYILC